MPAPLQVIQWVKRTYPQPQVDSEWLDDCYDWIISDLHLNPSTDLQQILENVNSQLLQSDLRSSMVAGTGLPHDISQFNDKRLRGPILVEITSITEIGHSAFTLQNVRQTRIDRADLAGLGEEEEEGADEDEGPIPSYPRSMLRFELSDGSITIKGMEYRKLPELELGVTPLGYKMLLKNVLFRRGIAFLEPDCVVLKGHQTEDREATQDSDFVRGLRLRMGLPDEEPQPEQQPPVPPPEAPAPAGEDQSRPIAGPANLPLDKLPRQPFSDLYVSPEAASFGSNHDNDDRRRRKLPKRNMGPPPPPSGSTSSTMVQSPYFSADNPSSSSSTTRASTQLTQLVRERLLSPTRTGPIVTDTDDEDESIGAQRGSLNRLGKQPARQEDDESFEDFGDDSLFMDHDLLDRVEKEALTAQASSAGLAQSVYSDVAGSSATLPLDDSDVEVVEISDDEDGDKENMPVAAPARRVRQRMSPAPRIAEDVIDISDSD